MNELKVGMEKARENSQYYFIQQKTYPEHNDAVSKPVPENIYFLTDSTCVSACLDFADLMMNIGVIHIGAETAGDTSYLEVLSTSLKGGIAQLTYPTAVHRGRERGDNVSYKPQHQYDGDISDTSAIEAWIKEIK
jgi:hypothetical protein